MEKNSKSSISEDLQSISLDLSELKELARKMLLLNENAGYEIQSRVMISDKECLVIGHNPKNELSPYVVWRGALRNDSWTYYWGNYCDSLESALTKLSERIPKKKSLYPNPTQVTYVIGKGQICNYGIAYENTLIDLYDGRTYELNESRSEVKIVDDEMGWTELDELFGDDLLYVGE